MPSRNEVLGILVKLKNGESPEENGFAEEFLKNRQKFTTRWNDGFVTDDMQKGTNIKY